MPKTKKRSTRSTKSKSTRFNPRSSSRRGIVIFMVIFALVGGYWAYRAASASEDVSKTFVSHQMTPIEKCGAKVRGVTEKDSVNGTKTKFYVVPPKVDPDCAGNPSLKIKSSAIGPMVRRYVGAATAVACVNLRSVGSNGTVSLQLTGSTPSTPIVQTIGTDYVSFCTLPARLTDKKANIAIANTSNTTIHVSQASLTITPDVVDFQVVGLSNGQTVDSPIKVETRITEVPSFDNFKYYIDNKLQNTDNDAPFCLGTDNGSTCNTLAVDPGQHTLRIVMAYAATTLEKVLTFTVNGTTPPPPPPPSDDLPAPLPGQTACVPTSANDNTWKDTEARVFADINQERAKLGVAPLALVLGLQQSSRERSIIMARNRVMSHGEQGKPEWWADTVRKYYPYGGSLAETIHAYAAPSVVVRDWMYSPGHRTLLTSSTYRYAGVGCIRDSRGVPWWTVNLSSH